MKLRNYPQLNRFQARNGRNVFSHPLPPTATINGPPTSMRWKSDTGYTRQVCFVAQDHGRDIFATSILKTENDDQRKNQISLRNSQNPVTCVDIVGTTHPTHVVIVQEDGTVTLTNHDLSNNSTGQLQVGRSVLAPKIRIAACLPANEARDTVLKSRRDLHADLREDSIVIATVTAQSDHEETGKIRSIFYNIWAVSPPRPTEPAIFHTKLLVEHDLTTILQGLNQQLDSISASFEQRNRFLTIDTESERVNIDVSGTAPQLLASHRTQPGEYQGGLMLSSSASLVVQPGSIRIIDTRFGTTRGVLDLASFVNRKRKRNSSATKQPNFHLVQYFRNMKRILVYASQNLLAVDIHSSSGTIESLDQPSSLAQNLGKGSRSPKRRKTVQFDNDRTTQTGVFREDADTGLCENLDELEKLAQGKSQGDLIAVLLRQLDPRLTMAPPYAGVPPLTPREATSIPEPVIDFALTKLFTIEASKSSIEERSHLKVLRRWRQLRRRLVENLSTAGALCISRILRAYRNLGQSLTPLSLQADAVAEALLEDDPSARNLLAYIEYDSNVDLTERTATVKLLTKQVLLQQKVEQQQLLTDKQSETIKDNQDEENAVELPTEKNDTVSITLMRCLAVALDKLSSAHLSLLSSAFRSAFTRYEVFVVIQFLRQQLFQGQFTGLMSKFTEEDAANGSIIKLPTQLELRSIVVLLLSCLDVIGPINTFADSGDDELSTAIVPDLLSEISLVTDAIEQCTDLQGILRETMRYGMSTGTGNSTSKQHLTDQADRKGKHGEIIILYAEGDDSDENESADGRLPLSLKVKKFYGPEKVRKGGGQTSQRSYREMAMLRDRERGPYSFERLVL